MSTFNPFKNIMRKETIEKKAFTYEQGSVHLGFTLRIDTKKELRDFKECLLNALEDVEKEIKK